MSNRPSFCLLVLFLLAQACNTPSKKTEEGKQLAATYCASCHQLPDPSLLNKETWLTGVLPEMGPRLGIKSFQGMVYPVKNHPSVPPGYFPDAPAMTEQEWNKLISYFYDEAPDTLARNRQPITNTLDRFEVRTPPYSTATPPVTCYIKIDPGNHSVYAGHGVELKLRTFNEKLQRVSEVQTSNVIVDIAFHGDLTKPGVRSGTLLTMGALTPLDVTHGSLQPVRIDTKLKLELNPTTLMDSLPRPVHIREADLNNDGKPDFVVCGFGNFSGALFWLRNAGNDRYEKEVLRQQPGSTQTWIDDFNKDGRLDILALMAQGDEGIFLYEQQPDGSFREKNILRFSSVAGSVSIDLVDFNKDGYLDIVYACGDNADFSKILKPYHGVSIYLNDGRWNFKSAFFFPINGCFKALARDFDLDGDIDIATIAYFADFIKRPEESFVYLQNEGRLDFKPFSFPQHSLGRWLTMDAGDIDGDGDEDLVLGNFSIGPTNIPTHADWRSGPDFVLLENKTR